MARFSAFNNRCTSISSAKEAKIKFLGKLVAQHPRHVVVQQLVKHIPDRRRIFEPKSKASMQNPWLVLPFHPGLGGMSKVLNNLDVHWSYVRGGGFSNFRPRLSWRVVEWSSRTHVQLSHVQLPQKQKSKESPSVGASSLAKGDSRMFGVALQRSSSRPIQDDVSGTTTVKLLILARNHMFGQLVWEPSPKL